MNIDDTALTSTVYIQPINPNDEIATAFDALARWLFDHPEVKAPYNGTVIHVFLDTATEMSAFIVSNPDAKISVPDSLDNYFSATKDFGAIKLSYMILGRHVGQYEDQEITAIQKVWVPSNPAFAVKE